MDRRDEILMYEPERIDPQAKLSDDMKEHYRVHQLLQKLASSQNRNHLKLSLDFNDRLSVALNKAQQSKDVQNVEFSSNQFFHSRSFLGIAAISLFCVGLGIIGYSYWSYNEPAAAKFGSAIDTEPKSEVTNQENQAKAQEPPIVNPLAKLPVVTAKPKEKFAAPTQNDSDTWADESGFINPETQLLNQISAESNPETRKVLQQTLLKLYESTGQTNKANQLRNEIK